MKITINIPDNILPSLEQFITKYFPDDASPRFHPTTGALLPLLPKWTPEEYIEMQMQAVADRATEEFPPASSAALIAQRDALIAEIKEANKVKRDPKP